MDGQLQPQLKRNIKFVGVKISKSVLVEPSNVKQILLFASTALCFYASDISLLFFLLSMASITFLGASLYILISINLIKKNVEVSFEKALLIALFGVYMIIMVFIAPSFELGVKNRDASLHYQREHLKVSEFVKMGGGNFLNSMNESLSVSNSSSMNFSNSLNEFLNASNSSFMNFSNSINESLDISNSSSTDVKNQKNMFNYRKFFTEKEKYEKEKGIDKYKEYDDKDYDDFKSFLRINSILIVLMLICQCTTYSLAKFIDPQPKPRVNTFAGAQPENIPMQILGPANADLELDQGNDDEAGDQPENVPLLPLAPANSNLELDQGYDVEAGDQHENVPLLPLASGNAANNLNGDSLQRRSVGTSSELSSRGIIAG